MTSFRGATAARPSWELAWTGWIGSAPVQISECGLDGAPSWWCDELLLVVVVLRLSVVPRWRGVPRWWRVSSPITGNWAADYEGYPPPNCSGQGEGQSILALSWAFRTEAAAPSFQICFECVDMYILYACVYICVCVYVCGHNICIYMHVCMYLYIYAFIHVCMCMCMHICA